jgi:hypothetical protein
LIWALADISIESFVKILCSKGVFSNLQVDCRYLRSHLWRCSQAVANWDVCSSESDAEYGDHGERWSYSEMYTPEMLGPDGKPKEGPQRLPTAQANALRAVAHTKASVPEQRQPTPVPSGDDDSD